MKKKEQVRPRPGVRCTCKHNSLEQFTDLHVCKLGIVTEILYPFITVDPYLEYFCKIALS